VYRARKYVMYPFGIALSQSAVIKLIYIGQFRKTLIGIVNMRAVNVMSNLNPSLPFVKPRI